MYRTTAWMLVTVCLSLHVNCCPKPAPGPTPAPAPCFHTGEYPAGSSGQAVSIGSPTLEFYSGPSATNPITVDKPEKCQAKCQVCTQWHNLCNMCNWSSFMWETWVMIHLHRLRRTAGCSFMSIDLRQQAPQTRTYVFLWKKLGGTSPRQSGSLRMVVILSQLAPNRGVGGPAGQGNIMSKIWSNQ